MSSPRWSGKTLGGRYRIEDLLGQGGMSAVYKATDPNLNRTVAIKLIHPHLADVSEFVDRFREEATAVAQMRHPNIVQVFDFNRDDDEFYMVMEFVAGETLRDRLKRLSENGVNMSLVETMKYAINICDAADYAHRHDLVHRDIKPANVMLDLQGQAILMDFGIAKIVGGPQFTATGATVGTALYMSPEQIRGERVDERSDIYAIGVVLFEMLCGHPPFQAESPTAVLMMHLGDPVPDLQRLRPDCPAGLKSVVEKAMAKDRTERYQHASEMSAALRRALAALQASLQAPTTIGPSAAGAVTMPPRPAQPAAGDVTMPPRSSRPVAGDVTVSPQARPPATGRSAAPPPIAPPPAASQPDYTPPEVVTGSRSNKRLLVAGCLLPIGALVVIGGVILVLLLLTRSGDEDGPGGAGTAVAETALTETAVALLPPEITEMPTDEPDVTVTTAPTNTPAPSATPEPSPTSAPRRLGLMAFLDNEQARAGSFQLTIAEAGSPADGSHYALWLDDDPAPIFLGAIEPGSGINFDGDGFENLLALYNRAFITVEPDDHNGEVPSGDPVFVGFVAPASLDHIRRLMAASPDSPGQEGYLVGAEGQALLAIEHGGFLSESLAAGNLANARLHAEHVNNILVGEESDAFGDLDGDGLAQNPGDGFGLITYLENAREHAQLAADADGASEEVKLHADHTIIGIDNALAFLDDAIRAAGRVIASDSAAEAQTAAEELADLLDASLNGTDANSDGVIAPSPGEGGILIAYEHALKMGSFEFFNAQDVAFD